MANKDVFEKTLHGFSVKAANHLYVPGKNLVYSPASLSYAMGMLLEGTDGQSRHEIMASFFDPKYNGSQETVEKASSYLMNLTTRGNQQGNQKLLSLANFFYSNKDCKLHPVFVSTIEKKYHAQGRELDFRGENVAALNTINSDVDKATKGLIPALLDSVSQDTKAVLVNAIHFKGLWRSPFKKDRTQDIDFTLSNGSVIKVPMMGDEMDVDYTRDSKNPSKVIKLRYATDAKDERIYMACILPEKGTVKDYLNKFNPTDFIKALDTCYRETNVPVALPRFKISNTHPLSETVKHLGIRHIFSPTANLSKMTLNSEDQLQVSDILQKAVIEVNEEGTEAAAATAIMCRMMCALTDEKVEFIANRPFLYAIISENRDRHKHILFIGVVENPLES